jgi:hypothetical protein
MARLDLELRAVRDGALAMADDARRMLDDTRRMRDDMNAMLDEASVRTRGARTPLERARR